MYQRSRPRSGHSPGAPAGIVTAVSAVSTAAHVIAAATSPAGVMAWWMAAMAAVCLASAAPMMAGRLCAGHGAGRLLAMNAAMILLHLVLLTAPGTGGRHSHATTTGMAALPGHEGAMLTLIAVELLCLMGASAALRLARAKALGSVGSAIRAAVEH
ncbi:hypothetical protein QFZ79_000183 [Arthrobacter sp. V4I6]|uniref:hypothetical protein n=1 Tax=unclassified Arthrobacter TaxID=235627 RepID=UPI002781B3C8|nr:MULTISPECIES: hypothetical protein [unclassified Arthrobacter]MDQ0822446.1 hypothetical protein [Arthrobacter sp. V1I7]MDQ0852072.1 hypothetical protein [Arthrobacter sp. V4I6]